MSKIIYFEDGQGGLLTISPSFDTRSRLTVGEGEAARPETDDEVAARVAEMSVPSNADFAIFEANVTQAEVLARFPSALQGLVSARAAHLRQAVEKKAEALRASVAGTSSASKLSVYREKFLVATAVIADADAAAASYPAEVAAMTAEATARGESLIELATLVITLGKAWRAAGLAIDAVYQTHVRSIDALLQANNLAALEAYDTEAGWL